MPTPTHRERVTANATNLSNLTGSAITKLNSDIHNQSAFKMKSILGDEAYADYIVLQNNSTVADEITNVSWTVESSTENGRKLKSLELAEGYCVVYYLSIALKQLDLNVVMTKLESFGEGNIKPDDIKNVMSYGDRYLEEAKRIAYQYSGDTGSIGIQVI